MSERQQFQQIRVFLSSPGDVSDERALVRQLLDEELPYDPLLGGCVSFRVVSWDNPAASTPMLATLKPQEAVNRFGLRPSECDVVVVLLWSRLGTHLALDTFRKSNGEPYLSGTEWEFEDACNAWKTQKRPEILVYRRTEEPKVGVRDPAWAEKRRQYDLVEQFFGHFRKPDDSFRAGFTNYRTPTELKERLATDLKFLLRERFLRDSPGASNPAPAVAVVPRWTGSPYPGLRPFDAKEAAIFFGRGREVDALIARLRDPAQRFLAVVGASGSGKSSLVRAGLLPRLAEGAIEGQHWPALAFTPGAYGDNPFLALVSKLESVLPTRTRRPPVEIATALATAPRQLSDYADALLAGQPTGTALVLFIDQFEELFTLAAEKHRRSFIEFLVQTALDLPIRVIITVRADFLPQLAAEPPLAALLQAGTFVLGLPGPAALLDMIRKPAERAGLDLEEGLANEMLRDAGGDPGALPLVAFCLEELYQQTAPEHRLTLDGYQAIGGLRGAIGRRAGEILNELRKANGADLDAALPQIFRALVHVDAAGKAARQRASGDELMAAPAPIPELVNKLTDPGRLLLAEYPGDRATVMLAHEALLQEWPALSAWLERNLAQMQRVERALASLASPEPTDRRWAVDALAQIMPTAPEVLPALIRALGDDDERIRTHASEALGRLEPTTAEIVAALITTLSDNNPNARASAAEAIAAIGPAAAEALPALIKNLHHDTTEVRSSAAEALGRLGRIGLVTDEVVTELMSVLRDKDGTVRRHTAVALGRIGPPATTAIPALEATSERDQVPEVRGDAAVAVSRIRG
jgi:hypothetical protein